MLQEQTIECINSRTTVRQAPFFPENKSDGSILVIYRMEVEPFNLDIKGKGDTRRLKDLKNFL